MRALAAGSPEPLGLTLAGNGANVAVYSAHATAIELCLFDAHGGTETERIRLPERTGNVFHGFVPGIAAGQRYGLRAHGPWDPPHGHRFNAAKLLVDPYATALDRRFELHAAQYGHDAGGAGRDDRDSAAFVPKAIAARPAPPAPGALRRVPWEDTVIYEMHVRGFTQAHPDVPADMRGTLAGLSHPAAVDHLARLGVTTVELMPLAAWIDERHLPPLGLSNYWGYNPVALMAPDPRLGPGGMDELAACVVALHTAGIEVLLDVVLNHTGEGDESGPTLSLRGLDNATYYRTLAGDGARYANDAGCGNTLALDRPPVLRLALDALRHYARAAGVDGFRFDLATTLARRAGGFDPAAPFLQAVAQDPLLRELKLVAEPWDIGPGGHRLGAFPAGWGEWNDRYRDALRRFWRGDGGMAGELATRLAGSADVFASRHRPPSRSVNFVTAHDGFTLADLVSHERKHNGANGEDNRDGTDGNLSWNHGTEGPSPDEAVVEARRRDARALLASLLLSRGTPMLSMGDELGRTQGGNNNAYAQDNALSWIDWKGADRGQIRFTAALIRLRREHRALREDRWLAGEPRDASGIPDVEWRHPDGRAVTGADWTNPQAHALVAVLHAAADGDRPADRVVLAFNAGSEAVIVSWPGARDRFRWRLALDSTLAEGAGATLPAVLAPRSVTALVEEASPHEPAAGLDATTLERLTAAAGIAPDWKDVEGRTHVVEDEARRALLAAMGFDVRTTGQARERLHALANEREWRRLPRVLVATEGAGASVPVAPLPHRRHRGVLHVSGGNLSGQRLPFDLSSCPQSPAVACDGRRVTRHWVALPALPAGLYALAIEGEAETCRLVVAPARCHLPPAFREGRRRFGLGAHLYSLRRTGDQGVGDFTTLALAAESTARAGGATVGVNPLHALFGADRERASPYHPSDRRFLDPIYIDLEAVPDLAVSQAARAAFGRSSGVFEHLRSAPAVDYAGVWQAKRAILEACFDAFTRRPAGDALVEDYRRFVAEGGEALRQFAAFEALASVRPSVPWQRWPAEHRRPDDPGVARFVARHAQAVDFMAYLQWLADRQLADAARRAREAGLEIGFYRDLAVGTAPDGAESWSTQATLARGASIGAPPDPFCPEGQVWSLPPPIPDAMAATGYENLRALIAANARHAGALRIDHVMGLARLFWIPDGGTAADGAYVRYPLDDLLGIVALESVRARCLIVGEDLGTVPEGFRERLDAADVFSYRVLRFERDGERFRPPGQYPAKAAACVSTHDLPTIAGWRQGIDIEERRALGIIGDLAAGLARAEREAEWAHVGRALADAGVADASPDGAAPALHRFIGATASLLALVQADDLAGETQALNLPGTDRERANWRRKVRVAATELWDTPIGRQAAADLAPARGTVHQVHQGTQP